MNNAIDGDTNTGNVYNNPVCKLIKYCCEYINSFAARYRQ